MSSYTHTDIPLPEGPAAAPTFADPSLPPQYSGDRPPVTDGIPRFFVKAVRLGDGSFAKVEYVEILTPGDNKASPVHKVTDRLRQKYGWHYDRFRRGLEVSRDGVPLEMFPVLDPAQVMTLKALNIFTVEDLAGVSDANLHRIPMGQTLRKDAQVWLKSKLETDQIHRQNAQMEAQQANMRMLEQQMADMARRLADAEAKAAMPEAPKGDMLADALDAAADRPIPEASQAVANAMASTEPGKRGPGRPKKE